MKSKILVFIQFAALALLAIVTSWPALEWWVIVLLAISGILAFWAMAIMQIGNFNVVPDPVAGGNMVTRGPYEFIRHPMYTSIIIFALALLAGQFDYIKLSVSLVLITDLIVKMNYEETLLSNHYADYKEYMKKTKRVIPFVW